MELIDEGNIIRGMMRGERGEDLMDALEQIATLADWQDAHLSGTGDFAMIELANEAADTFEDARILMLSGRIRKRSGQVQVELQVSVEVAGQVHAGRVEAALCGQILLVVDAVVAGSKRAKPAERARPSDSSVRRVARPDPTPRRGAPSPSPANRPDAFGAPRKSSPTLRRDRPKLQPPKRQRVMDDFDDDDDDDAYLEVEPGDYLQHPQLGLCRVVGDDASGGTRITVDGGRIRVLRLDALIVRSPTMDNEGRRVFPVVGPRKRRG